jgi:hypothetical protein
MCFAGLRLLNSLLVVLLSASLILMSKQEVPVGKADGRGCDELMIILPDGQLLLLLPNSVTTAAIDAGLRRLKRSFTH